MITRRALFGMAAGAAVAPGLALRAAAPALKITGMKVLRLRFPGRTARKRNSIIESGGGAPGMTYLELETDGGIVGRSIPAGSLNIVESDLMPRIRGENPFFIERIWDRMYHHNRKPVAKGEYIRAMGAVDIAVWDIIGKALGMPVYQVLGAYNEKLRVYAAGGYYEEGKGQKELAREMEEYVGEGFRAV